MKCLHHLPYLLMVVIALDEHAWRHLDGTVQEHHPLTAFADALRQATVLTKGSCRALRELDPVNNRSIQGLLLEAYSSVAHTAPETVAKFLRSDLHRLLPAKELPPLLRKLAPNLAPSDREELLAAAEQIKRYSELQDVEGRRRAANREYQDLLLALICGAELNAVIDPVIIAELYRASQAGVRIELVVRGICGLRPGLPGVSDRLRVTSVIGRLLEHTRILQFGPDEFWIGSADWMPRNLDRRVELLAPVWDPDLRAELATILDAMLADNVDAWTLGPDGAWTRRHPQDGEAPFSGQAALMERARRRAATG
jgi:hypothetical protein